MTTIVVTAIANGAVGNFIIKVDTIEWQVLNLGDNIPNDTLPTHLLRFEMHNSKGCVNTPSVPPVSLEGWAWGKNK